MKEPWVANPSSTVKHLLQIGLFYTDCFQGPKSSFITPEKRAKLRSNPVKVHFAEEVEVNGHSQGNSLLFLPNVLKVYLENGQTKAFKFEPSTTVKDIVMTLKEKLSLSRIEHFSLALEQQHSISKLLLLHDEERIHQLIQKKEAHDYRCLFRVCFMPKNLQTLLQDDPTAFEYLYLQGVNDVLQERFAMEMRCNSALRLAALHIQERLASCGQSPKTSLKTITKTWGIENFVSSTLLRNMREKDLKKAISYHLKKSQSQHDPKQKGLSVDQARINYLEELGELKSFGGKSFSATLMLQDRESMVTLLVGARYGVSQIVNHKLSILSTLTEFTSITRIELLPESDRVSLLKIYLQDIKPITLLLESAAAKDLSCLIAGYCRVFVDSNLNVFPWIEHSKKHRVSAEEGYVSRCCSDSDESSDLDMEPLVAMVSHNEKASSHLRSSSDPGGSKRKHRIRRRNKDNQAKEAKLCQDDNQKEEKDGDPEKENSQLEKNKEGKNKDAERDGDTDKQIERKITNHEPGGQRKSKTGSSKDGPPVEEQLSASETSDTCHTDSHVLTSPSSDSLDALEEDDLLSCSSSLSQTCLHNRCPAHLHLCSKTAHSHSLVASATHDRGIDKKSCDGAHECLENVPHCPNRHCVQASLENPCSDDSSLCFAELSRLADLLPSPPEASEDDENEDDELRSKMLKQMDANSEPPSSLSPFFLSNEFVFNFDQSDTLCYYKLCSNITPDSARSLSHPPHHKGGEERTKVGEDEDLDIIPILQPPPGFGDSSSDEEFFDARDRFTSPEDPTSGAVPRDNCTKMKLDSLGHSDVKGSVADGKEEGNQKQDDKKGGGRETLFQLRQRSRKRRSFMETGYTSMVSYPVPDLDSKLGQSRLLKKGPTVSSLKHSEGEPTQLESKPILSKPHSHALSDFASHELMKDPQTSSRNRSQEMEMEPDSMEFKSVTDSVKSVPATITIVRCRVEPDGKESADGQGDGNEEVAGQEDMSKGNEEKTGMSGNRSFTNQTHQGDKSEATEEERTEAASLKMTHTGAGRQLRANTLHACLVDLVKKANNNNNSVLETQSAVQEDAQKQDKSNPLSHSPTPPPPPSSPLHLITGQSHGGGWEVEQEAGDKSSSEVTSKPSSANKARLHLEIPASVNDEGGVAVSSTSDEITDSTNSDNVFEDDEMNSTLKSGSSDKQDDWTSATRPNSRAESDTGTDSITKAMESSVTKSEDQSRICSDSDYSHTINSITAKLGAAMSVTTPIYNCSSRLKGDTANESTSLLKHLVEKPKVGSTLPSLEAKDSVAGPGLTKPVQDLVRRPSSPTHFLFQSCSPSIMGRLSASTLRGKIQNLPLYLSRSQETLNKVGAANVEVTIKVTDVHDVTQTVDFKMGPTAKSVDSDDSDTTVTGSEVEGEFSSASTVEKSFHEVRDICAPVPVQTEPKPQQPNQLLYTGPSTNTPGPITEPPGSIVSSLQRDTTGLKADVPGPPGDAPEAERSHQPASIPPPIVVTTQSLNGPFQNQSQKVKWISRDRSLMEQYSDSSTGLSSGCEVFTVCENPSQLKAATLLKYDYSCSSVLASGCESVVEGVQVPLDACGCPAVYANCFGGGVSFDDELTLYEFSCRTQSSSATQTSGTGFPTATSSPMPSFLSTSTSDSVSFPRSILFSSSTSELNPLLSPLSDSSDCFLTQGQNKDKDTINRLRRQRYPEPPAGFQVLRIDVDQLLSILESSGGERPFAGQGGRHLRDTCPAHFTENKRVLQIEARRLMAGCQKVVGIGQSSQEMLHSLADSFRTLVELAGVCLWFSGCDRCDQRNAEAVAGLADVARSFRDFCVAAERASSKRCCQDLSTKLLAKQCTALTASVFCLTQLFRTLTSL
ncbi:FERM and PDZ domain-containing protein 1 isoform X2 [Betta splendens]|uniref:FERM and PDZ domain-containing protein 1 isoform X2 n=1 Tax=Betta splendens TaxID=158456 RepID=A0A9W2XWN6_BETSP|nr:FERM and PDZ domain-containing protein 1 isoform X2 [Betta splendens]